MHEPLRMQPDNNNVIAEKHMLLEFNVVVPDAQLSWQEPSG